jgi:glyoxylase-like metal-dependent hydrolase (beta-lactamase superfamily II)
MKRFSGAVVVVAAVLLMGGQTARTAGGTIDKLYVIDCGVGHSNDSSNWTNETSIGKPIDISVSCYLIHNPQEGYVLYETGISDVVASLPNGWQAGGNAQGIHWTMAKSLAAQLAEIKVAPSDLKYVAISHMHPDSYGNVEEFPTTTVLIQRREFEEAFPPDHMIALQAPPTQPRTSFRPDHPVRLLQGDTDIFNDGSAVLLATPGHTAGHESMIVHLAKTGYVILTADAVHLQQNWDNRRIPYFEKNTTGPDNQYGINMWLSMQRLADIQNFYKAQLWILHDIEQTKTLRHLPQFYE